MTRAPAQLAWRSVCLGVACLATHAHGQATSPALFVANNGNLEGSVSSFVVSADGSLAFVDKLILGAVEQSGQFHPGLNATSISLSPNGRFLAIGHATSSDTVEQVSIVEVAPDASLTLHATDTTPDSPLDLEWINDETLAVARTSLSLANQVLVYRFDERSSGALALTQIDSEPTGTFSTSFAIDAARTVLFANDSGGNTITAFAVQPDGSLEFVASQSTAPHYPLGIGCSSDGSRIYGGGGISSGGKGVVGVTFDGDALSMGTIAGSPFLSPGSSPKLVRLAEGNDLAFVGHGTDATIRVLAVDGESGALTDTGHVYDIGFQGTLGDVAVLGDRLYATDNSTIFDGVRGVRAFDIQPSGELVEIAPIADTTGVAPTALAVWALPASSPDLDANGQVDAADLAILLGAWGPCGARCAGDLDASGAVDAADLAILLGAWG